VMLKPVEPDGGPAHRALPHRHTCKITWGRLKAFAKTTSFETIDHRGAGTVEGGLAAGERLD